MHMQNWQSAESDLELTQSLVNEELEKGWVLKYPGTLAEAQAEYPLGVSVGNWALHCLTHAHRVWLWTLAFAALMLDVLFPERSTLPTAKEVSEIISIAGYIRNAFRFSLDIKSAHKRIVLHPTERGLVGFSPNGDIYFYDVTPLGQHFQQHGGLDWWFFPPLLPSSYLVGTLRLFICG